MTRSPIGASPASGSSHRLDEPMKPMTESKQDRIQRVARIVDPEAQAKFDFYQAQARACVGLGHDETADLWIGLSHETAAPSLSKASAIEAIYEGIGKDQERARSQPSDGVSADAEISMGLDEEAFCAAWKDYTRNPRTTNASEAVCRHFFKSGSQAALAPSASNRPQMRAALDHLRRAFFNRAHRDMIVLAAEAAIVIERAVANYLGNPPSPVLDGRQSVIDARKRGDGLDAACAAEVASQ